MTESDHDLLIRISTKIDLLQEQFDRSLKSEAVMEKDIKAAHRRMDGLTLGGILSIVVLGVSMWFK